MKNFILGATCMASLMQETHSFLDLFDTRAFNIQRLGQGLFGGVRDIRDTRDYGYQQKQPLNYRQSDSHDWGQARNDVSSWDMSSSKLGQKVLMDFDRNFINNIFSSSVNLKPGNYKLNLDCGAKQGYRLGPGTGNGMSVYWNKKLIKKFNIQDYQPHKFFVQLQSGGGQNNLQIRRQGQIDAYRITLIDTQQPIDQSLNVFNTKYTRNSLNLIKNGNFAATNYLTNSNSYYKFIRQLPSWQINQVQRGYGWIYNRRWGNLPVIELDGNKNDYLKQRIKLKKGIIYQFSLDYAARQNNIKTSGMSIYWNNRMIKKIIAQDQQIHKLQLLLTGQQGQNILQIRGQGQSDSYGMAITNVKLYQTDIPQQTVLVNPVLDQLGGIGMGNINGVQVSKLISDNINNGIKINTVSGNGLPITNVNLNNLINGGTIRPINTNMNVGNGNVFVTGGSQLKNLINQISNGINTNMQGKINNTISGNNGGLPGLPTIGTNVNTANTNINIGTNTNTNTKPVTNTNTNTNTGTKPVTTTTSTTTTGTIKPNTNTNVNTAINNNNNLGSTTNSVVNAAINAGNINANINNNNNGGVGGKTTTTTTSTSTGSIVNGNVNNAINNLVNVLNNANTNTANTANTNTNTDTGILIDNIDTGIVIDNIDTVNQVVGVSNPNTNIISSQGASTINNGIVSSSVNVQEFVINNNDQTVIDNNISSSTTTQQQPALLGFTQMLGSQYNPKLSDKTVLVCQIKQSCLIKQVTMLQKGQYKFIIQYTLKQGIKPKKQGKIGIYINKIKVNTLQPKGQQISTTDLVMNVESPGQFVFQVKGEGDADSQGFAVTDLRLVPAQDAVQVMQAKIQQGQVVQVKAP